MKSFFNLWILSEFSNEPFSLKSKMEIIDKRLLRLKPLDFFPNAPRSISTFKLWKANEFLYFILYYAPIILNGVMFYD